MMMYLLSVLFIVIGLIMIIEQLIVRSKWTRREGKVEDYIVKTGPFYTPVVRVEDEGTEYKLTGGDFKKQEYDIGETVKVFFYKTKDYVVIDQGIKSFMNAFYVLGVGIVLLVLKILA